MQKIFKQALLQSHSAKFLAPNQLAQAQLLMLNNKFFTSRIYCENLPHNLGEDKLSQSFAQVGEVIKVKLFQNREGVPTGKALVEFQDDDAAQKAIDQWDGKNFEDQVISVKPFVERVRTGSSQRVVEDPAELEKRVYLTNVAFGATEEDIRELAAEAATIDRVVIPKDR